MKNLNLKTKLILGITLTVFTLAAFGYYYVYQTEKIIYERSKQEVIVASNQISNIVQDRAKSYLIFLKGLAKMDDMRDTTVDIESKLSLLKVIRQGKFDIYLGISYLNGDSYTNDGRIFPPDSPEYIFIHEIDGSNTSNQIFSEIYKIPVIIYKEPLLNYKDKVIGFLYLIEEMPSLLDRVASSAYINKNMSYNIIDENHSIFVQDVQSSEKDSFIGKFDLDKIFDNPTFKKNVQNTQPYIELIKVEGVNYFVCLTPVSISPNWFILTYIKNEFLNSGYKQILNLSILTFFLVSLALSVLIVYLIYVQREYLQKKSIISTVLKSTDFYYLELNYAGKILNNNAAFRKKTGLKNSYLNSHFLHNICTNISRADILKLFKLGEPFELEILTNRDNILHVKWSNLSQNKTILQLIGVDFTAQKKAENISRKQFEQNNLQMIFDNVPIPLILRKLDDTIIMVNSALQMFNDKENFDFVGKTFRDSLNIEDHFSLQRDLEKSFNLSSAVTTEVVIIASDGSKRYFNATQVPLFDKDLVPSSILTVFVDITDSKNFNSLLKKEISRFQQILGTSPVGVIISIDGTVQFANPYAHEISMARVGQETIDTILDKQAYAEIAEEVVTTGTSTPREIKALGVDGQINYVLVSATTTTFQDKIGTIIWGVNINKLKKTEEELMKALDLSESATNAKSNFLANMSHEIRTPMNAIMGMNHLLKQTQLTLRQENYIEKIDISAKSLLRILNDILDFSKIETNQLKIECEAFELDVPIRDVIGLAKIDAEDKGLTLNLSMDETLPMYVKGDSARIYQILQNIISNAVKFTHKGMINVNIMNEHIDSNIVSIVFEVKDTGIGMTEQQLKGIFNSFTQSDTSTTRKYGGIGLGLSICDQLIRLMGGFIDVKSEQGKGTVISFILNLEIAQIPDFENKHVDLASRLKGCHLLLAEDNFINQEVAIEVLNYVGITTDVATNGLEAIELALKNEYTFILVDIQMPEMDGIVATQEMRKHDKLNNIPIIAMTAHAMEEDKEKALEAGMNDYVTKPIDPNVLYETLLKWLPKDYDNSKAELKTTKDATLDVKRKANTLLNIRGFNYKDALQRLVGNEKLLITLLESFYTDFKESTATFCEMLKLNEIQDDNEIANIAIESIHMAHTLKSVAGNLGMADIQEKAAEIEVRLKDTNISVGTLRNLIHEYDVALQPTIEDISKLLRIREGDAKKNEVISEVKEISQEQKEEFIKAIENTIILLESNDPDAELAFVPLHVLLKTSYADMVKKISKDIDSFEFDKAKISLIELAENFK